MVKTLIVLRHPFKFLKLLKEDYLAYKKGQHRMVPRIGVNGAFGNRGRVYGPETKGFLSNAKKSARCEMRVTRRTGEVEVYVSDEKGFRRTK